MRQVFENAGEEYLAIIKSVQLARYSKQRNGLHGSDILYCMRQAVLRKLEKSHGLSDTESFYFFRGEAIHLALEKIFGDYDKQRFLTEQTFARNDMTFTPDVIDSLKKRIIEIKTTDTDLLDKPWPSNKLQLKRYMAVTGIPHGLIVYLLLRNPAKPYLFFDYIMLNNERYKILTDIDQQIEQEKRAIKEKNPDLAWDIIENPFENWKCYSPKNPKNACPYLENCKKRHDLL